MRIRGWSSDVCSSYLMLGGNGDNGPAGITLSSGLAMVPTSAVSGFYFGHRDSQYFGVTRIGRDQLEDYADRSDERRVGQGFVSTCRSRRTPYHSKNNKT